MFSEVRRALPAAILVAAVVWFLAALPTVAGRIVLALAGAAVLIAWTVWRARAGRAREDAQRSLRDRSLFTTAHVGISITALDGSLRFANPAAADLLGYADVDSMLREVNAAGGVDALHISADERREFIARLGDRPGGWARMTTRIRRADGKTFLGDISSTLTRDPLSDGLEITTFMQDVTQRHELEAQLRQAQKMEAVGRLAGAVAHDFGTLIRVIGDHADQLPRGGGEQADARASILAACHRAMDLVQQLLTYGRHENISPEVVDVNAAVSDLVRLMSRTTEAGVELVVRKAPDLQRVYADARQIEQVLMNLIVNARDALPGEGRIEIVTVNCELTQPARADRPWARPGPFVRVTVKDNGCGIPPDARDHVYEPFFTTKGYGRGTGLGLATAFSIMRQHQGFIDFESELDRGTSFHIYLPALSSLPVQETARAVDRDAAPRGRGELVLVVDDDDLMRHLTHQTLARAGYQVLSAPDGEDALEVFMANAAEISLLVLDVVMPRMDGRALYENISELRPGVPVLFLSGYQTSVLESEYMFKAPADFFQKPFRASDLLRKVRQLLDS